MREFFEWLEETNELDRYEAILEASEDYSGDQRYRLRACREIEKLKQRYDEENK